MGWSFGRKPTNVMDWVKQQYNVKSEDGKITQRCIAAAMVNMKEIYAAVEQKDEFGVTTVSAGIIKIKFVREKDEYSQTNNPQMGYNFYSEEAGVYETNCPEKILKLLTPTNNATAREWRKKCYEKIEHRNLAKQLKDGDYIQFETKFNFSDEYNIDIFRIKERERYGKKVKVLTAVSNETGENLFGASVKNWRNYNYKKLDENDFPWQNNQTMKM